MNDDILNYKIKGKPLASLCFEIQFCMKIKDIKILFRCSQYCFLILRMIPRICWH